MSLSDEPIASQQTQPEKIVQVEDQSVMNMESSVAAVESILMYTFKEKSVLAEALTHSSYTDAPCYKRLKFLGGSVLQLAVSTFLFLMYPHVDPSQLSDLCAANLSDGKLGRVAVRHGLNKHIRHHKATALSDKVQEYLIAVQKEEEMVVHGGVMKPPKVLVSIVKSVAGAVYVDCGFNMQMLWTVFRRLLEPLMMLDVILAQQQRTSALAALYEACQKEGKRVGILCQLNGNINIASVFVDGTFIASGSSEIQENAKLLAVVAALSKLTNVDINESMETEKGKGKLFELCMKKRWPKPTYRSWVLDMTKKYVSSVKVELPNTILFLKGNERSKLKKAENSAASMILRVLYYAGYA